MTKDPLDDLFVCKNCGAKIAEHMTTSSDIKRELIATKDALNEALRRIDDIQKKL